MFGFFRKRTAGRVKVAKKATYKQDTISGVLNLWYARLVVRLLASDRISVYRKLKSLVHNRFSLMDAMERMYQIASKDGKNPEDTMAIAISHWMASIRNGDSLSVAMRGWAPSTELLMLSVGDITNLELALENTIKVVEGIRRMREPVVEAVSYPLFLLVLATLLIFGVGKYLVPPMVDAVPDLRWKGLAKSLVDLSYFVADHPWGLILPLPIACILIVWTFPRWRGGWRTIFDRFPPWSIYRIFIGVGWLLSLSALIKAGTPVSRALKLLRADASRYLLYRIDRAIVFVNNGDNLGDALYRTRLEFPDEEIIGDLRIYAELDNFPAALSQMADDWLENSVRIIEKKAAWMNNFAILAIAGTVAWAVAGTFAMQDQMVAGMGIGG